MGRSSGTAPTLRGRPGASSFSISSRPDRGKGVIYSIQWGFNVGNQYATTGEYVGLTTNSAKERFITHMEAAKAYSYGYAKNADGRVRSFIGRGGKKTDGDRIPPKLFYTAAKTAMGPTNKSIDPTKAYRFVTVLAHVNLFDLGATERAAIKMRKTFDTRFVGKAYDDIISQFAINSGASQKLGFNSTEGKAEGSKIKSRQDLTQRDLIAAAAYFIDEGRGSNKSVPYGLPSLRSDAEIKGIDLVEDIRNTFRYFLGLLTSKPEQIDKAGAIDNLIGLGKSKEDGSKTSAIGAKTVEKELNKLGFSYKSGQVKIEDREKAINIMINFSGTQKNSPLPLTKANIKDIVALFDKESFRNNPKAILVIQLLSSGDKRKLKQAAEIIESLLQNEIKEIYIESAIHAMEETFRKTSGNKDFKIPTSEYAKARKMGLERFIRGLSNNESLKKLVGTDILEKEQKRNMKKYGLDMQDYASGFEK
jgi:hypothetical protein